MENTEFSTKNPTLNQCLLIFLIFLIILTAKVSGQSNSNFNSQYLNPEDSLYDLLFANIPELNKWNDGIISRSDSTACLITFIEDGNEFLDSIFNKNYSRIYIGEDHPTHLHRILTAVINNNHKGIVYL